MSCSSRYPLVQPADWTNLSRNDPDKRGKADASRREREANGNATTYGTTFTADEIAAESRRPKRKVAVMIGYAGTGYKGMQITPHERTIEGDLFQAFVKAGAISKANADDPKKAGLVRCARTDKGVHAAGNMISLKLIVEDEDIVEKINEALSPQIRVWGIERTIGSFSCYQQCDSRWYEYLIPSYAFLPPHPTSWLAKQLENMADEAGDREGYERRQAEVKDFWEKVEEEYIKPTLEEIDEDIRFDVVKALQGEEEASAMAARAEVDAEPVVKTGRAVKTEEGDEEGDEQEEGGEGNEAERASRSEKTEEAAIIINPESAASAAAPIDQDRQTRLRAATKQLRRAYNAAKRAHRIPPQRIQRLQEALSTFVGTKNFHNYTIQKSFRDPSAKRHIKSFVVNPTPILIKGSTNASTEPSTTESNEIETEWLSLKIHGQSFMMHQIRKMVSMAVLLTRCGTAISDVLPKTFTETRYSVPKVPGLGLLLERPVFDSYNQLQAPKHGREALGFEKFEQAMEEFKKNEVYGRIFGGEEKGGEFGRFFNAVDCFRGGAFLWVGSGWKEGMGMGDEGVKVEAGVKEEGLKEKEAKA